MGWTIGYCDRASVIKDLTAPWVTPSGYRGCILKKCFRGNVLWKVVEIVPPSDSEGPPRRYIGCDLLRRFGPGDWGYTDMDEGMHPYYYTCPLSYLGLVTKANALANSYNEAWRVIVREEHLRTKVRRLERTRLRAISRGMEISKIP